jgi:hypothetical protein
MKFTHQVPCRCGHFFSFSTYGDQDWPSANCTACGYQASLINPLSVSVPAERLLYRSNAELEGGDFSLSIVIATIAVESFLTRLFLKLKGMDSYVITFSFPTPSQEAKWELEYPRTGGFPGPADFVSTAISGTTFDEFVANNNAAKQVISQLPDAASSSPKKYFQSELFRRRNRIVHWGYLNSTKAEAQLCQKLAVAIVSILREMDRLKYGSL